MAPAGQARSQAPQATQLLSHTSRASEPFSVLEQRAVMVNSRSTSWMMPCSQERAHSPHPMQADVSTTATPRSLMWMAFLRHTPTHVPQPMQPCLQPCRSQPPLHMTTATGWGFLGRVAAGLAVLCLLLS